MSKKEKIVRPTECPDCHSSNIRADVATYGTTTFYLRDGRWEDSGDRLHGICNWGSVDYMCLDCEWSWSELG